MGQRSAVATYRMILTHGSRSAGTRPPAACPHAHNVIHRDIKGRGVPTFRGIPQKKTTRICGTVPQDIVGVENMNF